ncbi:MAG: tetratricopeptide repeat protein, partial [bacterium]
MPVLEALVSVEPGNPQARSDLAAAYAATGNGGGAEAQFQGVLRLQSGR